MVGLVTFFNLRRSSLLLLFLITFGFPSCSKKKVVQVSKSSSSLPFTLVWKTLLANHPKGESIIGMDPVLYEDRVLFSSDLSNDSVTAPVFFLDTADGSIKDIWSDYYDGHWTYNDIKARVSGDYLMLSSFNSINCIDMSRVETQWHGPIEWNTPPIFIFEGYIYRGIEIYNGSSVDQAAIMRTPVDRMDWDTVYHFTRTDYRKPLFDGLGFGYLANGDAVMVWKNRSGAYGNTAKDRTDIFAFNLSADTLMWRDISIGVSSGYLPLEIVNGVVYGAAYGNLFAFNLEDGTKLWESDVADFVKNYQASNFDLGAIHFEDDYFIVKGSSDEMIAVNMADGTLKWYMDGLPYNIYSSITAHNDVLYIAAHYLVVFDVQKHEILFQGDFQDGFPKMACKIVLDPLRKRMYFHDGYYAYCYQLPNEYFN